MDPPPVDGVLATALAAQRDRLNGLVAQARQSQVDFDVAVLERQLRGPLKEVVLACERVAPGSGPRVLAALFEPVIDLVGQRRLTGGTHDGLMARLPPLARLLVAEPRQVFGSLANAIVHLRHYGAPVEQWLDRVERAGSTGAGSTGDAATALRAGQVAAWALGLSHFRDGALAVASTLTDAALGAALGLREPVAVAPTVAQLYQDRWWQPGRSRPDDPAVVHRAGGFRGFGGPFLAPPRATACAGHIVVRSGDDAWTLHADAWGATLTRTDPDGADETPGPALLALDPSAVAGVHPATAAALPDLIAVTVASSYDVLVVRPGR